MATYQSTNQTPRNYAYASAVASEQELSKVRVPSAVKPGPNAYAVQIEGDCLVPSYRPNDLAICDPDQTPEPGDFVAVWWRDGKRQPVIKRLMMGLPDRKYWHIGGEAEFVLMLEQLNPQKCYSAKFSQVDAVHKVIHRIPAIN